MKVVDLFPPTSFRRKTDKGGIIKYMAVIGGKTVINIQLGGIYGNAVSHLDKALHKSDLDVFMTWPEVTKEQFTKAHADALRMLENNLSNKVAVTENTNGG